MRTQFHITRDYVRAHRDWYFCFGDNEYRSGYGGQAIAMRGEPNAIGIRTKVRPGMNKDDYWYDKTYGENCQKIDQDLNNVAGHLLQGKTVVIPEGIGSGLSELPKRAPATYRYLKKRLELLDELTKSGAGPNAVDGTER